ncbi:hypothetical protein CR513_49056, partial [Mucuna pruriens]
MTNLGLCFKKSNKYKLVRYYDVDSARDKIKRKNTSEGCHFIRANLVSWVSKRQGIVSLSIVEAKLIYNELISRKVDERQLHHSSQDALPRAKECKNKRKYHKYLEECKKKKGSETSTLGIYVIKVNLSTPTPWETFDYESYDTCASCFFGKMIKTPFTIHQSRRKG